MLTAATRTPRTRVPAHPASTAQAHRARGARQRARGPTAGIGGNAAVQRRRWDHAPGEDAGGSESDTRARSRAYLQGVLLTCARPRAAARRLRPLQAINLRPPRAWRGPARPSRHFVDRFSPPAADENVLRCTTRLRSASASRRPRAAWLHAAGCAHSGTVRGIA